MDNKTRAEKIANEIFCYDDDDLYILIELTQRELDEAINECLIESIKINLKTADDSYAEGFAAAREKAAVICDGYAQFRYSADTMIEAENMAKDIRTMEAGK